MEPPASLKTLDYGGLPVLHLFHQFSSVGGVESVLRHHYECDPKIGVDSDLIIYLDEQSSSRDRVHCLEIRPDEKIANISQKLEAVTAKRPDRTAIYHLPWGFRFFCPHDHAKRRILMIHSEAPILKRFLKRNAHFLDGVLCVNQQIREIAQGVLRDFPAERIGQVNYPIKPPLGERETETIASPVRLGFIGRLHIEQKRIERIPGFCAELERLGVNYHLAIIGDGANRDVLETSQASHQLELKGLLHGTDYWNVLRKLDCLVYFSDYEGTPISMLEGLSQGIIPIYPKIGSGGDSYVEKIDPALLYPSGDAAAAAAIVRRLTNFNPRQIAELRQRCRALAESHSLANYLKQTFDFTQRISQMPRTSGSAPGLGMSVLKYISLKQLDVLRKFSSAPTR